MLCKRKVKYSQNEEFLEEDRSRSLEDISNRNKKPNKIRQALRGTAIVELTRKNSGGLGLGIAGGSDKNCPPIVSCLRPGSVAHRSDALQVGDYLTSVNGIKVTTLTHEEILTVLRNAGETVTLEVEYDLSDIYFDRLSMVRCKTTDITIDKEGGSFGFTIRGGSWGPDITKSRPITITAIRTGGPADREGRLRVGDRIMAVDNTDVTTSTHAVASELLKKQDGCVTLTVEYDVSILESVRNANGPLLLEIDKPPGLDLGVTLCIERHSDDRQAICIASVIPASVGDRCGALHEGDEILSIDGIGLEYTTLAEAHQLLKGSNSGQIKLEIIPLSLMQSAGFNTESISGDKQISSAYQRRHSVEVVSRRKSSSASDKKQLAAAKRHEEATEERKFKVLGSTKDLMAGIRGLREAKSGYHSDGADSYKGSTTGRQFNSQRRVTSAGSLTASVSGVPSGQVCHGEVMEVVLSCYGRGGYGLVLHRSNSFSDQSRSALFISYIERGSPAEKSGVLHVGDRILTLNEWCANGGTSEEANYIIRHATGPLTLTVEFDVIETVLPSSGVFTVKLAKRGQNLGIVIVNSGSGLKGDPVVVSDIRTGSVAHRCGSIHPGDQLLAIDNIPLDTCTVEESVRLLHRSSDIVKLRVRKNPSFYDELDPNPHMVVYSVELSRKGGPLGLTIAGTDDRFDPIVISQLAPGGLAERTGALHIGDRLLAINGSSLQGKRVSEAIQILQQAGETVSIKIARTIDPMATSTNAQLRYNPYLHSVYERNLSSLNDHYNTHDMTDTKLGTPVQSIDSAVESLEDSPPLTESNQNQNSSNRNSHNSKSSSLSGQQDTAKYVEDLSIQLHRSLTTLKSTRAESNSSANTDGPLNEVEESQYQALGGDSCLCQTNLAQAQDEWMRVLEALETVGEAEMLRKLEESIMQGTVPCDTVPPCKPGAKGAGLSHPFPVTNTILRHPMGPNSHARQQSVGSTGSGGSAPGPLNKQNSPSLESNSNMSVASSGSTHSSTKSHSNPTRFDPPTTPLTVATGSTPIATRTELGVTYDNIPFITSPMPSVPAMDRMNIQTKNYSNPPQILSSHQSILQRTRVGGSPFRDSSGPQVSSGSVTPSVDDGNNPSTSAQTSTPLNTAAQQQTQLSGGASQPQPLEVHRVTLAKDKIYGDFGFSISDGTEKGVFINKIRTGGPAEQSGNIRHLDRLLQVNDQSLRDLDCLLAVPLLAAAGDRVDLILCRDPNLSATHRLLYAHQEVTEEESNSNAGELELSV